MRCPKCRTETSRQALHCPSCKLPTPRGRYEAENLELEATPKLNIWTEGKSADIKPWVSWVLVVTAVGLCCVGSYFGFLYYNTPPDTPPPMHQALLDRLRFTIASHSWMTVEERLEKEVDKAKNEGRLVEMEGWDVRQIEDGSYNVSFSFQEKDNKQQSAVWNVTPANNIYVPKTDLAESIFKKRN